MNIRNNQQPLRYLIVYLILSLLFAMSVKLHIQPEFHQDSPKAKVVPAHSETVAR